MANKGIDNITKPVYELLKKEKVEVIEGSSVTSLSSKVLDKLRCGDVFVKVDSAGKHAYIVSYKKEDEMCLTYADHERIEEVYFEKGASGWEYIQTDTTELAPLKDLVDGGDDNYLAVNVDGGASNQVLIEGDNVYVNRDTEIDGALYVVGTINGDEIVENMSGYSFIVNDNLPATCQLNYVGVVKNGNKITFAIAGTYERKAGDGSNMFLGSFVVPNDIQVKLISNSIDGLDNRTVLMFNSTTSYKTLPARIAKSATPTQLPATIYSIYDLTNDTTYEFRYEATFLLSDSLYA